MGVCLSIVPFGICILERKIVMSNQLRTMVRVAACGIVFAFSLGAAGIATADAPQDNDFLSLLGRQQIVVPDTGAAINEATAICVAFGNGVNFTNVALAVRQDEPNLSDFNVGYFIGDAVNTYCSQYSGALPS